MLRLRDSRRHSLPDAVPEQEHKWLCDTESFPCDPEAGMLNSLPPPRVHPGLVPVVLIGVIQQLIIGRYDPLSPPPAGGATYDT